MAALRVESRHLAAVIVLAWGGIALALVLQYWFGYEPCPWCTFQRLVYALIGLLALGAVVAKRARRISLWLSALVPALALAGAYAAWHQHAVAARSDSCALTLADRILGAMTLPELWPAMFEARARCDEANLPWLGIPFALWSLGLFITIAALGLSAFRTRSNNLFLK